MDEIEVTPNGITFREEVEVLGEIRPEEKTISYDQRDEYEVKLNTNGFVPLDNLVAMETEDGDITKFIIKLRSLTSVDASLRTQSESSGDLPQVPRVDIDSIEVEARRNFYQRLRDRPDSQPAKIRRIIHEAGELTRQELNDRVRDAGYEPSGGGVGQSLVVLESVTNEIERHGRGEDQRIVWKGA